jgi:hypothetical protein
VFHRYFFAIEMGSTVDRFPIDQRSSHARHCRYNYHPFIENIFDLLAETFSISKHRIYDLGFAKTTSTTEKHNELTFVSHVGQRFELIS